VVADIAVVCVVGVIVAVSSSVGSPC
jgi:hypothetical protein